MPQRSESSSQLPFFERYNAALALAAQAHRAQRRKGKDVPYIVHPMHVSTLLLRYGCAEDVVLAGLLHDVLEDSTMPAADLAAAVGDDVLRLVQAVTEVKRDGTEERSWEIRKAEQLAHLEHAPLGVLELKSADALHNVRETLHDVRAVGSEMAFSKFKRGPEASVGYYRRIAAVAERRLGTHPLVMDLIASVAELAAAVGLP